MKHLKLYEAPIIISDSNILSDFFQKREDYETIKNKILELVNEYVKYNKEYFEHQYFIDYGKEIIDVTKSKTKTYAFKNYLILTTENNHNINLREEDSKKLVDFLEDPDLYRNAKKYNISS